jgi:hypothetical protein
MRYNPPVLTALRQLATLTDKVVDYEKLLKRLKSRVNDADARLIQALLGRVRIFSKLYAIFTLAHFDRRRTVTLKRLPQMAPPRTK